MSTITKAPHQMQVAIPGVYIDGVVVPKTRPSFTDIQDVFVVFIQREKRERNKSKDVDELLQSLQGSLKSIPEFQGKSSVEVQHSLLNSWVPSIDWICTL